MKGNITILVDGNGARIEVEDESSGIRFLKINLSAEQFMACLGRLYMVKCDLELRGLDQIGKTLEVGNHEFKVPAEIYELKWDDRQRFNQEMEELAQDGLMDGWIPDNYFESQGSFFKKDGEQWARVTIRRWV